VNPQMANIQEILQAVSEELRGVANGDAVLGSPVQLGPATVYPISMVSVGMGGGGGEGEHEKNGGGAKGESGVGGGAGGGARARPMAVLVFSPEGVKVLPLPQCRGPLERILDRVPGLLDRLKDREENPA